MYKIILITALLAPQLSFAEVFMCTDPTTGQKSFTDKACPTLTTGTKVKVTPTNFGGGIHREQTQKTWNSQLDTSVSGTSNLNDHSATVAQANAVNR